MEILKRPLMTEKTLAIARGGYYTFVVSQKSNKAQIAQAVSKQYNVKITDVRTAIMHGKVRRVGKKMKIRIKPNWKKAIVRVAPGQKIDAFDVSHEQEKK
ncbi:50S ribosomal protein L23 [Candidatus Gottesmanbacteria bacterium]|nr:50S ribosomal protein L23 [Candidatus Gottesmanbacteria bacterium]